MGFTHSGTRLMVPVGSNQVEGRVLETRLQEKIPVYLIRADPYFDRKDMYGSAAGDYPDNAERFIFFSRAALQLAEHTGPWDILHVNDWQSALVAVYQKTLPARNKPFHEPKVLLTIHNLAYQGVFPPAHWHLLNLESKYNSPQCLEYYNNINFLKGGMIFADQLSTVSRRYAAEILEPEYGCGLDGVLRERRDKLVGILNGADYGEWNPETDPHIAQTYGLHDLGGKKTCKEDLQRTCALPTNPKVPLIGMVTRLVEQKGIDIFLEVFQKLSNLKVQLVLLGSGEQRYEKALTSFQSAKPNVRLHIGFDNVLAHRIEAGADLFLMPSRFEPCGLNQIYSLRYGTIPVVRATGGLDDTIQDFDRNTGTGNGFKFDEYSGRALLEAVKRAVAVYRREKAWRQLMTTAMTQDFSWRRSAEIYLNLYQKMTDRAERH